MPARPPPEFARKGLPREVFSSNLEKSLKRHPELYKTLLDMYDTKLRYDDDSLRERKLNSLAVYNHFSDARKALSTNVAPSPAESLPTVVQPRLGIEKHLHTHAIEVLRLANSRTNGQITIARAVRQILGIKVTGNLPWENTPQWDTLVALVEQGYLNRKGKGAEGLDSNGQAYVDVVFEISSSGRSFIEQWNAGDVQWTGQQSISMLGDAGLRVLQILAQPQGEALRLKLTLDFMTASPRLQKLLDRNCISIATASSDLDKAAYVLDFQLTNTGYQHLQQALAAGWKGWSMDPWSRDYQTKARQHFVDMLERSSDRVDEYQPAIVQLPVVPQIASTRRGRGGFGMTAHRYGAISEPTSFRFRGRKAGEIELFQHQHGASHAEFNRVTGTHNQYTVQATTSNGRGGGGAMSPASGTEIKIFNTVGDVVYDSANNVVNFPSASIRLG